MREKLQALEGVRVTVRATFARFGTKRGWQGREVKTVLLTNLTDVHGHPVCDHLWFACTKGFEALNLQPGDRLELDGRSKPYVKGYQGMRDEEWSETETDFKLSHPTNIRRVIESKAAKDGLGDLPLFANAQRL